MVGPFCLQSVSFPHLFKVMTQSETLGQKHYTISDFQLFASSFLRILPNIRPSITVQDISWRKEKKIVFVTICSSRTIRTGKSLPFYFFSITYVVSVFTEGYIKPEFKKLFSPSIPTTYRELHTMEFSIISSSTINMKALNNPLLLSKADFVISSSLYTDISA